MNVLKDRKGQISQVPSQMILLLIVVVVGILVIKVFSELDDGLASMSSSTSANAAAGNFSSGTYDGFQMLSITPYIAVAAIIIMLVMLLLSGRL